jgi:hypothetical protein
VKARRLGMRAGSVIRWSPRDRIVTKLCKELEVKPTRRIAIVAAVAFLVSCSPPNPGDKPG